MPYRVAPARETNEPAEPAESDEHLARLEEGTVHVLLFLALAVLVLFRVKDP